MSVIRRTPSRRDLPPEVREYVEKLRGNAFVLAVMELGGRLELTEENMNKIRGYGVKLVTSPDGRHTFVVAKMEDK